jgi:hypothetical protein
VKSVDNPVAVSTSGRIYYWTERISPSRIVDGIDHAISVLVPGEASRDYAQNARRVELRSIAREQAVKRWQDQGAERAVEIVTALT